MILVTGLIVRHYGVYKNINYVPLSDGQRFTSLIGENGVGKSSVLDALDKYFNQKDSKNWVINKQALAEGGISTNDKTPFISPIFLISKEDKEDRIPPDLITTIEAISNTLWSSTKKSSLESFSEHKDHLKSIGLEKSHYILTIGKRHNDKEVFLAFSTFEQDITKAITDLGLEPKVELPKLLNWILDSITFLYIPVETNAASFTKLEASDMQTLMDKNIQDEVGAAIEEKTVKTINKNLDAFIKEIESKIPEYRYKATSQRKNLTKLDIVQKTIEAYFSVKVLHRKIGSSEIPIQHLSSGEKRKALVDLAYAYLVHGEEREKNVLLAIDEPESSLHVSACFNQFESLKRIARNRTQLLITTHWYGHLPISSSGKCVLISKDGNEIRKDAFDLANYRERISQEKKTLKQNAPPYSVQLKGYNDLVQSIIESLQSGYNWIICEGSSEKIYFEYFFKEEIEKNKLCILPCGGAIEVLRIARYIQTPLQDKDISVHGKVLCIIDTDIESKSFERDQSVTNLFVHRLLNVDGKIELVEINDIRKIPATEIEDALEPKAFIETLKKIDNSTVNGILDTSDYIEEAKTSGDCLDLKITTKALLKKFFDEPGVKYKFSETYVDVHENINANGHPAWIEKAKQLLENEPLKKSIKVKKTG